MDYRSDRNNNPTAFTTALAAQAGLKLGTEFVVGDSFDNETFSTAKLIGDSIELTIRVIDSLGFWTQSGRHRWMYIAIPHFIWMQLSHDQKRDVIGFMYGFEGGTALLHLFPNGTRP